MLTKGAKPSKAGYGARTRRGSLRRGLRGALWPVRLLTLYAALDLSNERDAHAQYLPIAPPLFALLAGALILLLILVQIRVLRYAYMQLGVSSGTAFFLLFASLVAMGARLCYARRSRRAVRLVELMRIRITARQTVSDCCKSLSSVGTPEDCELQLWL